MLENLRDKIINVQQDLSVGFRNFASGEGQLYRGKKNKSYKGIPLNAGSDLLNHYQMQWQEMHEVNAENAKRAENVDIMIGNIHKFCGDQLALIRQLNLQLSTLPQLQNSLLELMGKIGELEGMFEEVEDALTNLEDTTEIQELQERQLDHRFQLAMYKEKRLADFENYKLKLAQDHAQKVKDFEKRQQAILKERQTTFQEVFEEELHLFKTQGLEKVRERVSSTGSGDCSLSLENIELGEDAAALDEFLGDEAEDPPVKIMESEESSDPDGGEKAKNSSTDNNIDSETNAEK